MRRAGQSPPSPFPSSPLKPIASTAAACASADTWHDQDE